MKLLFDHNLSPRLVNRLADIFPNSNHLFLLGLDPVADKEVWRYARDRDYIMEWIDVERLCFSEIIAFLSVATELLN